jgi:hypothetical protein
MTLRQCLLEQVRIGDTIATAELKAMVSSFVLLNRKFRRKFGWWQHIKDA